jgi:hypothetical protein
MPTVTSMLGKRDWAKDKMEDAVRKGNISEAKKYQEISAAYDGAANKIRRGVY